MRETGGSLLDLVMAINVQEARLRQAILTSNVAELDALIKEAGGSGDQAQRRKDYVRVQQILAAELPSINLWYLDAVLVHTRRLGGIQISGSGSYDFLRTATVADDR